MRTMVMVGAIGFVCLVSGFARADTIGLYADAIEVNCNIYASAGGLMGVVNGDSTCPCGYPVPLEETTWGSVKALYGEKGRPATNREE